VTVNRIPATLARFQGHYNHVRQRQAIEFALNPSHNPERPVLNLSNYRRAIVLPTHGSYSRFTAGPQTLATCGVAADGILGPECIAQFA
jgi:hypothetical protein